MMIISKYKDYYDSAVGMGIDKTIIYNRSNEDIYYDEVKKLNIIKNLNHKGYFGYYRDYKLTLPEFHTSKNSKFDSVSIFIIGFCGKYYLGFKFLKKEKDEWGNTTNNGISTIIYDSEKAKKELTFSSEYSWQKERENKKNLIAFNVFVEKIKNLDDSELFFKYKTPIVLISGNTKKTIELNPLLKDYEFYKAIDTYTAFQEIQMYISGVLGTNEDGHNTPMSEKEKVQQHGFDSKYGFRTRPKS